MPETTTATIHRPGAEDYRTLLTGAGLFDRSARGKLALSGPDAATFLDSLLSNDIGALEVGTGADAALLTHKGRMLAEVRVLRTASEWFWLDTERACLQALFDALHNYRIGYRAELHKRTLECGLLSLIGPRAGTVVLEGLCELGAADQDNAPLELAGSAARAVRTDVGMDVICDAAALGATHEALLARGASEVGEAAVECLRIERGRPRFGVELDETTMPQEAGIHDRTVSFTKGCYVGQETVARLYWKGKPNRHLRGLVLSEPVAPGSPLALGDATLGTLASCAVSPSLGPIGLALVRREAEPGSELVAGDATATVVELPFRPGGPEGNASA